MSNRMYLCFAASVSLSVMLIVAWPATKSAPDKPTVTVVYSRDEIMGLVVGKTLDEIEPNLGRSVQYKDCWEFRGMCQDKDLGPLVVTVQPNENGQAERVMFSSKPIR